MSLRESGALGGSPRRSGFWVSAVLALISFTIGHAEAPPQAGGDGFIHALRGATELEIGPFHLMGFRTGSIEVRPGSRILNTGIWHAFSLKIGAQDGARVRIHGSGADGDGVILEGTLTHGRIDGEVRDPTMRVGGGLAFDVEVGGLQLTLGNIRSNLKPLYGGTLDLSGRKVWIEATEKIEIRPFEISGRVGFETSGVTLVGARIDLMGDGSQMLFDLAARDPEKIYLDLNLGDGAFRLAGGELVAKGIESDAREFRHCGSQVIGDGLKVDRLALVGQPTDQPLIDATGLRFANAAISHQTSPLFEASAPNGVQIAALEAKAGSTEDFLSLSGISLVGIRFDAAQLSLVRAGVRQIVGSGLVSLDHLTVDTMSGKLEVRGPTIAAVASTFASATTPNMTVSFSGAKNDLDVSGNVAVSGASLATLAFGGLEEPVRFASGEDGISFEVEAPGMAGNVEFHDPALGGVKIAAELQRLAATGRIVENDGRIQLAIPAGGFELDLLATAVSETALYGAAPLFGGALLGFGNSTAVTIAEGNAEGALVAAVEGFAVAGAGLRLSNKGAGFRLNKPLQTGAQASVGYELATSSMFLHQGNLTVEDLDLATDPAGLVALADLDLETPRLKLKKLELNADGGVAKLRAEELEFSAERFTHRKAPEVSGVLEEPVTIAAIAGDLPKNLSALEFTQESLSGVHAAVRNAEYLTPDGLSISAARVQLDLGLLTRERADGSISIEGGKIYVEDFASLGNGGESRLSGQAALQSAQLSFEGSKDEPTGNGTMHITSVGISGELPVAIENCARQPFWMGIQAGMTGAEFEIELADGELTGAFGVESATASVGDTGYYRCEFDKRHTIAEATWMHVNPCWPGECTIKTILTPKVEADVHWIMEVHEFKATGAVRDVKARLAGESGLQLCGAKLELEPAMISANYHPNVRDTGNPITNLPRDIIRGVATVIESSLATQLSFVISAITKSGGGYQLFRGCPAQPAITFSYSASPSHERRAGVSFDRLAEETARIGS